MSIGKEWEIPLRQTHKFSPSVVALKTHIQKNHYLCDIPGTVTYLLSASGHSACDLSESGPSESGPSESHLLRLVLLDLVFPHLIFVHLMHNLLGMV